jgi:putative tricarboxylic transport membrane protein
MLAVAGLYYAAATALPASQLDDAVGPQGLPKSYAVVLAILAAILVVRSLRAADVAAPQRHALSRVAGMLLIGIVYVVVAPWIGYMPALAALIMVTTYYQGGPVNRRAGIIAVSGAILFWVLFVFVLGIPQPAGFWPSLF